MERWYNRSKWYVPVLIGLGTYINWNEGVGSAFLLGAALISLGGLILHEIKEHRKKGPATGDDLRNLNG